MPFHVSISSLSIRIAICLTILVPFLCNSESFANDKIKLALKRYEQRVEEERAKVIAAFEKESKIAAKRNDEEHAQWLAQCKSAWMNNELVISERGGLKFFNGAEEVFSHGDFNLSGGFTKSEDTLRAENGNATVRLVKPAKAVYFRGVVESKNNFMVQLCNASLDQSKDISIIVGGWNNTRSEIRMDNRTVAEKPVGMPRRWLCEVYCQDQVVTVLANGAELMTAKLNRPLDINIVNVSVSYDSQTSLHSPVVKVK